jgi:geranylgeranyl pyrophosphate synthase
MGKSLGSDIIAGKKTFLTCKAEELDRSHWREFMQSLEGESLDERIPKIRDYFGKNGIVTDGEKLVKELSEDAISQLEPLPSDVQANLTPFVQYLMERKN